MSEAYIVLGYHRSGTSLATGILKALGVSLGDNYKLEGPKNPCFFEDNGLIDNIVHGKGTPEEVVARLSQAPKWAMKLPQLVDYWDRYKPLIPNPNFVVTRRNLVSIIRSVHRTRHDDKSYEAIEASIHKSYEKIAHIVSGHRYIIVDYERWFPPYGQEQFKELADFTGLRLTTKALRLPRERYRHFP